MKNKQKLKFHVPEIIDEVAKLEQFDNTGRPLDLLGYRWEPA